MKDVSIIIPTYNEAENIGSLLVHIDRNINSKSYEVIVVDDDSPDNTYAIVRKISKHNKNIKAICRKNERGLGTAVLGGILCSSGERIIVMDADWSHNPSYLTDLINSKADIAIGSRYCPGGKTIEWGSFRKLMSSVSTKVASIILGMPVYDPMSGLFMCSRSAIDNVMFKEVHGFKILFLILSKNKNASIEEIPIDFVDRANGESKANVKEIFRFLRMCYAII